MLMTFLVILIKSHIEYTFQLRLRQSPLYSSLITHGSSNVTSIVIYFATTGNKNCSIRIMKEPDMPHCLNVKHKINAYNYSVLLLAISLFGYFKNYFDHDQYLLNTCYSKTINYNSFTKKRSIVLVYCRDFCFIFVELL